MSNVTALQNGRSTGLAMQPSSLQEAMQLADMLAKSGMVPKQYINNPQGTLVAMMMGQELGLNPIQSLQNIAVINGKPSIYADALLALVQNHPAFGGIEEELDEQTMTARCTVWRKGDAKKHTQTFSQKDAQTASLWGKQGPWTQYPKRMLMWRARGFALRDKFADALGGLITVEEARDYPVGEKDVTPKPEQQEPKTLEYYPASDFDANFSKWQKLIITGKKTANDIIATVSTKGQLTDQQVEQIKSVQVGEIA
jgi:hypothetical protein